MVASGGCSSPQRHHSRARSIVVAPEHRDEIAVERFVLWVQDWVQVAAVRGVSRAVSCAGSTNVLTATNQEVAGSSPAGPTNSFILSNLHCWADAMPRSGKTRRSQVRILLGPPLDSLYGLGFAATRFFRCVGPTKEFGSNNDIEPSRVLSISTLIRFLI